MASRKRSCISQTLECVSQDAVKGSYGARVYIYTRVLRALWVVRAFLSSLRTCQDVLILLSVIVVILLEDEVIGRELLIA